MEECLTVVFTHNPQDFYGGIEPEGLNTCRKFLVADFPEEFVSKVRGGYDAITTLNREE